jgi:ArsR family transcriptional regulator
LFKKNPFDQLAEQLKAFSDPNRIRIIALLMKGEKTATQLNKEIHVCQPTLSHHMKILCDCGIVKSRREGKWMHYAICCEGVRKVRSLMQEILSPENIPADCNKEG